MSKLSYLPKTNPLNKIFLYFRISFILIERFEIKNDNDKLNLKLKIAKTISPVYDELKHKNGLENYYSIVTSVLKILKEKNADVGIVVDPDVDRLALVCNDGSMFGEEYTLVAVSDYVLKHTPGSTVSNMSSTRALRDVTENHAQSYTPAAVGEVNVVKKMKDTNAVIGGEGNGGIIYPASHYGRDALVGVALFLSHLAKANMSSKELRMSYPAYFISKNKIQLTPEINVDQILKDMQVKYASEDINTEDGVKINFAKEWVHLRKSNTEPIIRIYAESEDETKANTLAEKIIADIKEMI